MAGLACVKCRVFLKPARNGVLIEEGRPLVEGAAPGGDKKAWGPYKLWKADLAECPSCGFQVVVGFAPRALSEHFMPDYEAQRAEHGPTLVRIDACTGYKP